MIATTLLLGAGHEGKKAWGITAVIAFCLSNSGAYQTEVDCPEGKVAADEGRDQQTGHPGQPPLPCHVGVDPAQGLGPQPRQGILQEVGH